MTDLVGTAAAAALLRRALKRASAKQPELSAVVLKREGLEYAWVFPVAWHDPNQRDAVEHLRRLVRDDLHPLFRELTGPVIAHGLAQVPELVEAGLAGEDAAIADGIVRLGDGAARPDACPRDDREAHVRTRTAAILADVAHTLESGQDAEARVRRALAALRLLVPFDRCALVNVGAGAAPRVVVGPPLPEPARLRLEARAEAMVASLCDRAARVAHEPRGAGVASHLAVPLVALDELAGVLLVERDESAYGEEDLQLLSVVAALLGAWLASLALHAEERRVAEELRAAVAGRTHFLRVLSHELRNPLGPIANALYVLDRVEPGSERAQHSRAIVSRQFDHLTRLVDDLLDATRLASGKVQVHRARLDLAALVRSTVEDHRSLFDRSGVGLEARVAEGPLWMDGDAVRLSQVVGSLLSNAARFASPGGRAEVSLAREAPGTAVVRVHDDGAGIAPDVRSRLFEPFAQRADTLDPGGGGLGLGLALAKGFVDLHDGTIAARSDGVRRGTELVVTLPLLKQQPPAAEAGAEVTPERCGGAPLPDRRQSAR